MARGGRGRRISVLLLEAGQVCLKYFPIFLWFEVYGGSCVSPACYRADNFIFSCCAAWLSSAGCYNMMHIQSLLTLRGFWDGCYQLLNWVFLTQCALLFSFYWKSKEAQTSPGLFDELSTKSLFNAGTCIPPSRSRTVKGRAGGGTLRQLIMTVRTFYPI